MSLMPKLLEINDELVRVREERDRLREERDQAVENAVRLQAELDATRKQLQDVCSAKRAGQNDLVRDVSHYIEAAEVDRPTEPQPEQDGVLVQEGWWLQADGNRVYVRPTNPTASNKRKIAQGYVWSDGARLYHSDGGHGDTPTPHDLVKFLGKELQPAEPQQHPAEYTPPEGWRVLQYGELLQPGDHWVNWEGTVSRPDIQHGDGATVSGGRYIRWVKPQPQQPKPELEFKPYTFAAYIVGDKRRPHALRIVWATEDWIEFSKFSIVHRISDLQFSGNDTFTPDQFSVNLKIQ